MEVRISPEVAAAAPELEVYVIEADVVNGPTGDDLWAELHAVAESKKTPMELVRHRPGIDATRRAYKALGKEPNRYRPSAEALMRRVVSGKDLYRTTALVDLINLASIATGHSIGAFDADKISGERLTLGVGQPGEPYEAIGRGMLNIECLPVFRDAVGGIGTPTSDNERTCLGEGTRRLLVTLNCYGPGDCSNAEAAELVVDLVKRYGRGQNVKCYSVKA